MKKYLLSLDDDLHAKVKEEAQKCKTDMNSFLIEVIKEKVSKRKK